MTLIPTTVQLSKEPLQLDVMLALIHSHSAWTENRTSIDGLELIYPLYIPPATWHKRVSDILFALSMCPLLQKYTVACSTPHKKTPVFTLKGRWSQTRRPVFDSCKVDDVIGTSMSDGLCSVHLRPWAACKGPSHREGSVHASQSATNS